MNVNLILDKLESLKGGSLTVEVRTQIYRMINLITDMMVAEVGQGPALQVSTPARRTQPEPQQPPVPTPWPWRTPRRAPRTPGKPTKQPQAGGGGGKWSEVVRHGRPTPEGAAGEPAREA
eukprot:TRINITY_DN3282_c0_g1_i6.p5 TRINITY_DN3282_c0_g1~~TRINITY_DN3282_c0_g1_i6.p5  ORF type:complete len:120 (+),score=22.60 TRINITY_DN3282_c0_g1_i6:533-892(+)